MEHPAIPPSLLYRIRTARRPKVTDTSVPQFHDTVDLLIKILKKAAEPGAESINTESKAFMNKIGLDSYIKEFFELTRFSLIDKRFHPPDHTPENIQLLNRCRFQLQILLLQENPALVTDVIEPACNSIMEKLGCAKYERDPKEKVVDLTNRSTLISELQSHLGKLGCVTDMSDEIIIDAFEKQISHDVTTAHSLVDVLVETQKKRHSERLDIEIACRKSEGIVTTAELRSAYMDFDIPNFGDGINDDVLMGLLRASLGSASRENLKIIAKARNNNSINQLADEESFFDEPMTEDPSLDIYYAQHPVGLSNIGNTCYLNSLLQYIYTIKDIRETVMNMEAYVENESAEGWEEKVIDGRKLSQQDVAEAKEIVTELRGLFTQMASAKSRSVSPSSRLVELLLSTGKDGLTDTKTQRSPNESFEQQDVSETMTILMYRLNAAFKPILSEQDNKPIDRFNSLFYVKAIRKAIELDSSTGKRVERLIPEDFSTLLLNVKEPITMEELIDDYFDAVEPEFEGQNSDQTTTEIIDKNETSQSSKLPADGSSNEVSHNLPSNTEPETGETAAPPEDNSTVHSDLDNDEFVQLSKISELTTKLKEETVNLNQAEYKIHAVFHHEGGANFGHYWVYILDEASEEPRWFKYSDDFVSEVGIAQENEIFNGVQGSTACFCVYVRSNIDVVQTVWRSIS
ncbi:hypothetical protein BGZ49_006936 [Haplosporangium sp. Z 27]|nr:hypothetical protein BGZ49_006936 [Haplosporangium sp. Z 27]